MDLIIFAHPDSKSSHNASVLRLVQEQLDSKGRAHEIIDLYADGFEPVLSGAEYAASQGGKNEGKPDPLVPRYQELIKKSDNLIFIYPVWWYGAPAMLKGFFDRVFTPGFAYNFKKPPAIPGVLKPAVARLCGVGVCYPIFIANLPITPHLKGKRAIVINTFGGSSEGFALFGRAPEFSVDKAVLNFCGISPVARIQWWEARGPAVVPTYVSEQIKKALA